MTKNIDQNIIDKINKLLALGQSPNEHEAKLAIANAQKLLTKHNLSMKDILVKEDGIDIMEKNVSLDSTRVATWKSALLNALCFSNYCKLLISTGYKREKSFKIVGTEVNVETVLMMYDYLYDVVERVTKKSGTKGITEKNSFRLGMVNGIYEKLKEIKQEMEYNGVDEECTALMVVNFEKENKKAIDKYLDSYKIRKSSSNNSNINANAFSKGHAEGRKVNLNKQIKG
jgi:hypothetical protein